MSNNIIDNLNDVKNKIKDNLLKANRKSDIVKLVAVSKNHTPKKIIELLKAGHNIFGENRVQELLDKNELFYDQDISWHFIGHLQKNKVKYLMKIDQLTMIESVDSIEIAKTINSEARDNKKVISVLLQINIANDSNKFGFKKEEVEDILNKLSKFKNIDVCGLMTITPYYDNPENTRQYYKDMKILLDEINKKGYNLTELSMGMSNDYHIAVQEGATIVRVGTAIFGKRKYY